MIDYINNRKHLHLNKVGTKNTFYSYKHYKKKKKGHKEQKKQKKYTIKDYAIGQLKRGNRYENKIYHLLKAFFNFRIVRQFIIDDKYIVDIYIPEKKLIIEVDGKYHDTEEQKIKDKTREDYIKKAGFEIIRFRNEDVKDNLLDILEILQDRFSTPEQDLDNEYRTMVELVNT